MAFSISGRSCFSSSIYGAFKSPNLAGSDTFDASYHESRLSLQKPAKTAEKYYFLELFSKQFKA
jgi:hypothetical protein